MTLIQSRQKRSCIILSGLGVFQIGFQAFVKKEIEKSRHQNTYANLEVTVFLFAFQFAGILLGNETDL